MADILLINVPASLIKDICANGGLIGKTAFTLLDALLFGFTWRANTTITSIKIKYIAYHQAPCHMPSIVISYTGH